MADGSSLMSSGIFKLIDDIGYSIGSGLSLTQEQLEAFVAKYKPWSHDRDQAAIKYLTESKKYFRGYIPFDERVIQTAVETSWYFDELVIFDPIKVWVDEVENNREVESAKLLIPQIFQVLKRLRPALEAGYLVFSGISSTQISCDPVPEIIQSLSENVNVIKSLDEAVRFGMIDRSDSEGRVWKVGQAILPSGGAIFFVPPRIPLLGKISSPGFRFGEELPAVPYEELKGILPHDPYSMLRERYPDEIKRTLRLAGLSAYFGAVPIFSRNADAQILAIADGQQSLFQKSSKVVGALNLSLPYLRNVSPERIMDIRNAIPEAFRDFRNVLIEVIEEIRKEQQDISYDDLVAKSERKIFPLIRKLESELKAASSKARIIGYGIPAVAVFGSLVGCIAGPQLTSLLSTLVVSSLTASVKAFADYRKEEELAKGSPIYFLWKVNQLRKDIKFG